MARTAVSDYVDALCKQFPTWPSLTLAKKAIREQPALFRNLEAARSAIRKRFGVSGKAYQRKMTDKTLFRQPRKAGSLEFIPQPQFIHDWKPFPIAGPHTALVLSDIHIPFLDKQAVELAVQTGLDRKATLILLNGDIMDHFDLSKFDKNPKHRDFPAEIRDGIQFLAGLRKAFPKARIIYKHGNHEERYDAFMRMKCEQFIGIEKFEWSSIFELAENKIELVKDERVIMLGKLPIIHGHEYRWQISNPVNPARGYFLKAKMHVLAGHCHRSSYHPGKTVTDKLLSAWSTGCLCGLHPEYARLNEWNHGFAIVTLDRLGNFNTENLKILHGKVWA